MTAMKIREIINSKLTHAKTSDTLFRVHFCQILITLNFSSNQNDINPRKRDVIKTPLGVVLNNAAGYCIICTQPISPFTDNKVQSLRIRNRDDFVVRSDLILKCLKVPLPRRASHSTCSLCSITIPQREGRHMLYSWGARIRYRTTQKWSRENPDWCHGDSSNNQMWMIPSSSNAVKAFYCSNTALQSVRLKVKESI